MTSTCTKPSTSNDLFYPFQSQVVCSDLHVLNRVLKISQLLRHCKKFKLLRMSKYAATLNFFCSLPLEFLNTLLSMDCFQRADNGHRCALVWFIGFSGRGIGLQKCAGTGCGQQKLCWAAPFKDGLYVQGHPGPPCGTWWTISLWGSEGKQYSGMGDIWSKRVFKLIINYFRRLNVIMSIPKGKSCL